MSIFSVIVEILMLLYIVLDIICVIRNYKYQKLWNKEKATKLRVNPNISRAELCEYYVMFCLRNDCKVDF
jgi:hypothetical protein